MEFLFIISGILGAYLLGSVPTAVLAGKWFYNIDIRDYGSHNAGATNTFRVLGTRPGIIVFIIDTVKGLMSVLISKFSCYSGLTPEWFAALQIALGMSAVVGHIFPVWAQFRGGKGVATTLGMILAVHPYSALFVLAIFIVVFLLSGYVSLGSISAGFCYPFFIHFVFDSNLLVIKVFSILISLLIIATHRKNIIRLIQGNENRFSFSKK